MASYMVNNFMLGELSPRFFGHPDNQIYFHGASKITNGIVTPQGGVHIVPGTYYKQNSHLNGYARMLPYTVDEQTAFTILLTDQRMEIIGETVAAQVTVWTEAQLDELDFEQYGDALYVVHRSHPVQKIVRTGATTWTVTAPSMTPFATANNYPGTVTSFEGRLVFGATNNNPNQRWATRAGTAEDFGGTTDAADSWNAKGPNPIHWMVGGAALFVGTSDGIYRVGGKESITTPENAFVEWKQSGYSVGKVFPVLAGESVYFIQKSGKAIRKIVYDMVTESFVAPDVTIYSEHLFKNGVKRMVFQAEPETVVWIVTSDGKLLSMMIDDQSGTNSVTEIDAGGYVEDLCIVPSDGEDIIRVIVRRFIDGAWRRHVDEFAPVDQGTSVLTAHYVHAGTFWDGGPALPVTLATQSDPLTVTVPGHSFSVGHFVRIRGVTGMPPLEDVFYVSDVTGNVLELQLKDGATNVDSTEWPAYNTNFPALIERVTSELSGLTHLDQEDLYGIADGGGFGPVSPLGGDVDIGIFANKIHIGYPYQCYVRIMPIAFAPNKIKRVNKVYVRFLGTAGAYIGEADEHGNVVTEYQLPFRRFEDIMGEPTPPFDGMMEAEIEGDFLKNGAIFVRSAGPLPFMITSIMVEVEVFE